jgi:hypothetical protein
MLVVTAVATVYHDSRSSSGFAGYPQRVLSAESTKAPYAKRGSL